MAGPSQSELPERKRVVGSGPRVAEARSSSRPTRVRAQRDDHAQCRARASGRSSVTITQAQGLESRKGETSCDEVVHIGDSTSIGLMSPCYLPNRSDRIAAQYRRVGRRAMSRPTSPGARSIVEVYKGEPNAFDATKARIDDGYDGCWVFAMGTNDTANQYVGGVVPDAGSDRTDHGCSRRPAGALADGEDRGCRAGRGPTRRCRSGTTRCSGERNGYPNMRIYDWRRQVKDGWFSPTASTSPRTATSNAAIASPTRLALAFPAGSAASASTLVAPR